MNVNLFGENMFLQAEKAAFDEAEKKKEEEVNFWKHIWNLSLS